MRTYAEQKLIDLIALAETLEQEDKRSYMRHQQRRAQWLYALAVPFQEYREAVLTRWDIEEGCRLAMIYFTKVVDKKRQKVRQYKNTNKNQ